LRDYITVNCSVCGYKSVLVLLVSGFIGDLFYVTEISKYVPRKPEVFASLNIPVVFAVSA